jgi:hypothetical protein
MEKSTFPSDSVGELINKAFLAVRLQCDTSKGDSPSIRSWYNDAHLIMAEYHVGAFPTFLFFSPEGEMVHFGIGYRSPKGFIALARDAMDPQKQYVSVLKDYTEGRLPYEKMPDLVRMAGACKDSATRSMVSKDYVHNYLDRLADSAWERQKNLLALTIFIQEMGSNNGGIRWILRHPKECDSIVQRKGFSEAVMNYIVYKEEVSLFIEASKKDQTTPSWDVLVRNITAKYADICAKKLVVKGKLQFYRSRKDWANYCNAVAETVEVNEYSSNPKEYGKDLNNYAFEIFLHSDNREMLMMAVKWMEPVLASTNESSPYISDMLDTQAELLYKLGRKDEAIAMETRAVEMEQRKGVQPRYQKMLEKMRAGEPAL